MNTVFQSLKSSAVDNSSLCKGAYLLISDVSLKGYLAMEVLSHSENRRAQLSVENSCPFTSA